MSETLRVILLVAAVLTAYWILMRIRRLKVRMEDAIFWVIFAIALCILGLFPELTYWLTRKVGVQSPANLIFLVIIALLIEKVFTLSIIVSQLEDKISVLSAEIALRSHAADRKEETIGERLREDEKKLSAGEKEKEYPDGKAAGSAEK